MNVEDFITRWTAREGGAERANYQMFLSELCDVLGVPRPEPAGVERDLNDYVFERAVSSTTLDRASAKRIDLYKKAAFILEAKQTHAKGGAKAAPDQLSLLPADAGGEPEHLGRRSTAKGWDVLMRKAFNQANDYVHLLPTDHAAPPFLIVADVGHCFEIYADFSGTGRGYAYFPDRKGFRIFLDELRDPAIRARLAAIWTDPHSLDPTRESARVTRQIAERLAAVSKALEAKGARAEDVALFLMRCIFTMFAEDVELLPKGSFTELLRKSVDSPERFPQRVKELWTAMDTGGESMAIDARVLHFNGGLFKQTTAFELGCEAIGELLAAASHNWREVEPAIFGTLVEQALDPAERRRLGAHYTPRAYVERLVNVTVMEPLRADWRAARTKAEGLADAGDETGARAAVRAFHHQLCTTRVLDPACGTANFLYVSLELMKTLEAEVLETLVQLGEPESIGLETVDPHQFLGIELNPRAAAIAELVLWLGYLQQHYKTRDGHPAEPILKAFHNIDNRDAVLTWDGYPLTTVVEKGGTPVETYPNARRPEWPEAEFIVGNPPFIGKGAVMREAFGDAYLDALKKANKGVAGSADFVMQWWDRAAEVLLRKKTRLRRFGLVTTNSITQSFSRRVTERHLSAKTPLSLIYAIPDHPWTKAGRDAAAVRIAMTVAEAGQKPGRLLKAKSETEIDTDTPSIELVEAVGVIHADLSVGADVTLAKALAANDGLSCNGVMLAGEGFVVSRSTAEHLIANDKAITPTGRVVLRHVGGSELTQRRRDQFVIDFFGLSEVEARQRFPAAYGLVLETVKPERERNSDKGFRENWWLFGRTRPEVRRANEALLRYIATTRTSKHRIFQFLEGEIVSNHEIVVISSSDAFQLGVLSSSIHSVWALRAGGTLEDRPRYNKARTFDPFPFPDPADDIKARLRDLGEELDATRRTVLAEHGDLTLTGLYNLLEKVRAGTALTPIEADQKTRGRVLILKELHDQIDAATADAYGWPRDLTDEQILERLVALNADRAREEAAGQVRWLRPDYQIPRFAKGAAAKSGELDLGEAPVVGDDLPDFPKDAADRPPAVLSVLDQADTPLDVAAIARRFNKGGKRIEQAVVKALPGLVRYGHVTALQDGRYAGRRAG